MCVCVCVCVCVCDMCAGVYVCDMCAGVCVYVFFVVANFLFLICFVSLSFDSYLGLSLCLTSVCFFSPWVLPFIPCTVNSAVWHWKLLGFF